MNFFLLMFCLPELPQTTWSSFSHINGQSMWIIIVSPLSSGNIFVVEHVVGQLITDTNTKLSNGATSMIEKSSSRMDWNVFITNIRIKEVKMVKKKEKERFRLQQTETNWNLAHVCLQRKNVRIKQKNKLYKLHFHVLLYKLMNEPWTFQQNLNDWSGPLLVKTFLQNTELLNARKNHLLSTLFIIILKKHLASTFFVK